MEITAAAVKDLRERTGAGFMDCKRALEESGGDIDKAVLALREKGLQAVRLPPLSAKSITSYGGLYLADHASIDMVVKEAPVKEAKDTTAEGIIVLSGDELKRGRNPPVEAR